MILLKETLWPYFQMNNTLGNPGLARFYLAAQMQALSEFSGFRVHCRNANANAIQLEVWILERGRRTIM